MKLSLFRAFILLFFPFCFFSSYLAADSYCSEPQMTCCYDRDFIYVGGGFNYAITYLPQNVIVDVSSAFENNPELFVGPQTQRSKRSSYRWNAYIGYERLITCNWRLGLEFGYRDLGRLKTEYLGTFVSGNGINAAPFREVDSCAWNGLFMAKYQFCCGLNIFAKIGAALVLMDLKEGNFVSTTNSQVSFLGPFATYDYQYQNIYPELAGGVGYRFCNILNLVATWGYIFGPFSGYNFIEGFTNGSIPVLIRPEECPGYGYLTVGIEIPCNLRAICRLWERS